MGRKKQRDESHLFYIDYTDSAGNRLKANEIYFVDEESFQGRQTLEIWGEDTKRAERYTVDSPGVEYIFDDSGNFPIALISPEGKRLYLKVSAKSGEVLPIHAGSCKCLEIIYVGPISAGKTVSILQMSDPAFHDAVSRGTNCSFEDDLPVQSRARLRYERARKDLKNHILPEKTKHGEYILPYVYYFTCTEGANKRHILIRLQDIDGESCVNMSWKSKILPYDYFFFTIGADELLAGEHQYAKVIDQLLPRLRVFRRAADYKMVVIVSKADLLDRENPYLKDAFENSVIVQEDGKIYQIVHGEGFDYKAFIQREESVRSYLKDECPGFYNKLLNAVPERNITFCMTATIGESGDSSHHFEKYNPFCVDEPLCSVLAEEGMYPVAVYPEGHPEIEKVQGGWGDKVGDIWKAFKEKVKIDDLDDEEE